MIRCVSPYRSSLGSFDPGDEIRDARLAAALLVDSPGSFTSGETQPIKAITEAIEHRGILQPGAAKAPRRTKK